MSDSTVWPPVPSKDPFEVLVYWRQMTSLKHLPDNPDYRRMSSQDQQRVARGVRTTRSTLYLCLGLYLGWGIANWLITGDFGWVTTTLVVLPFGLVVTGWIAYLLAVQSYREDHPEELPERIDQ